MIDFAEWRFGPFSRASNQIIYQWPNTSLYNPRSRNDQGHREQTKTQRTYDSVLRRLPNSTNPQRQHEECGTRTTSYMHVIMLNDFLIGMHQQMSLPSPQLLTRSRDLRNDQIPPACFCSAFFEFAIYFNKSFGRQGDPTSIVTPSWHSLVGQHDKK